MGNMSNPNISRWGVNLFWSKFWYTDKNFALNLHQDRIFIKLILVYLKYGVLYPTNIFINKYWYLSKFSYFPDYYNEHNTRYYRVFSYDDEEMNIHHSYNFRERTRNYYAAKIWILRYQGWLVINYYAYQPLKKRRRGRKKKGYIRERDTYLMRSLKNNFLIKRLKFLLFYSLNLFFTRNNYYRF